jgi:hypothetical protein
MEGHMPIKIFLKSPFSMALGCAIVAITIPAGNAANAQSDEIRPSTDQAALVRTTCSNALRVERGTVQFDACMESLSRVLVDQEQIALLSRSYEECAREDHREGTPQFATCVLDHRSAHMTDSVMQPKKSQEQSQTTSRSYVGSTPQERHGMEEYACAKLGLTPGRAAFSQCVAELGVNMWNASNPS